MRDISQDAVGGHFDPNTIIDKIYSTVCPKDEMLGAVDHVRQEVQRYGIIVHAMASRWALHHSALSADNGDGVIIGSSSMRLERNLKICDAGSLSDALVRAVDAAWETARADAPRA